MAAADAAGEDEDVEGAAAAVAGAGAGDGAADAEADAEPARLEFGARADASATRELGVVRHATTEPAAFIERTYDAAAYARMRDDAARTGE